MAGRDSADNVGSFFGGSSDNKNFIVGDNQIVGPFKVGGNRVTLQFSPRPGYVSGPTSTLANIVVQGSLDKKNWYPITTPSPINALGIWTFDVLVPWLRIIGNFGAAEGTIYIYSLR